MARPKKNDPENVSDVGENPSTETKKKLDFNSLFKEVDKLNPDGETLSSNTLSFPNDWIDTGNYALNAIISGSFFKGIPVGRITCLDGESGVGKSLILQKIIANAQKKGFVSSIWDSEMAIDKESASNLGVDVTKCRWYPASIIEQTRNEIGSLLNTIIEENNQDLKVIVGLDSLGNMYPEKLSNDIDQNKTAQDQGHRAKTIKAMLSYFTYKFAKAKVPFIFTNQVYDGPEMYPTKIKKQSGGKGPIYLSSVVVQFSKRNLSAEEKVKLDSSEKISSLSEQHGIFLKAYTAKNRIIPQGLEIEIYVSYSKGISRYSGLVDIALDIGYIIPDGRSFKVGEEGIGYRKEFEYSKEFWKKHLPIMENVINERWKYSKDADIDEDFS